MTIYFEDFVVGHVFEFGDVEMTEEEIIDSSGQGSPGMEMTNQDGIVVMSMSGVGMYGRRPSTSAVD